MKLLPARALMALAAVADVALHGRSAPVAAKAIATRHGLTPRHLETVLQELVRANILKAYRGPRGGYELARERRRISAGEIVRAAGRVGEGAIKPKPRPHLIDQVIEPALREAGTLFLGELDRISVDDLCRLAEAEAGTIPPGIDFTI